MIFGDSSTDTITVAHRNVATMQVTGSVVHVSSVDGQPDEISITVKLDGVELQALVGAEIEPGDTVKVRISWERPT
jgi:hypothetical protein